MNGLRCLLVAACVIPFGCDAASDPGRGVRQVSWSTWSEDHPSVPGVDQAMVLYATRGGSPAIVFWCDVSTGRYSAAWDKSRKAACYEGRLIASDERTIDIKAFTADGKTGDVTIDGQTFDLSRGDVFLLRTADGETTVKQSHLTIPWSEGTETSAADSTATLQRFASTNSELREFFDR